MTSQGPVVTSGAVGVSKEVPRRFRWLWEAENIFVALALAVLMVLPLIEIVGRKLFHGGLQDASALQQSAYRRRRDALADR